MGCSSSVPKDTSTDPKSTQPTAASKPPPPAEDGFLPPVVQPTDVQVTVTEAPPSVSTPAPVAPVGNVAVNAGIGRQVRLPDGTLIERSALVITLVGPSGAALELSPIPAWAPPAERGTSDDKFVTKEGMFAKLSNQKDIMGGEKWQDRFIKLGGSTISYYASSTDTEPRGSFSLVNGVVEYKEKGSPRRKDAFGGASRAPGVMTALTANIGELASPFEGNITRNALAVHKPADVNKTIDAITHQSVLSLAAGGASQVLKETARTYYLSSDDVNLLKEWETAIANNIKVASTSGSIEVIKQYLARVGGSFNGVDEVAILDQLYGYI